MISTTPDNRDAAIVATNLRRLMAKGALTFDDVVAASGLDERTLRAIVRAKSNAHARTLHKLATGFGVSVDELFRPPSQFNPRQFDRATNTLVQSVVASHADMFANWSDADFDELYSRFGTGGQLTEEGVLAGAAAMNAKRDVWRQVSVILESGEADILTEFVDLLYRRTTATPKFSSESRPSAGRRPEHSDQSPSDLRQPADCDHAVVQRLALNKQDGVRDAFGVGDRITCCNLR
jgi:transcriptional regulator with XRE-family HTH domain